MAKVVLFILIISTGVKSFAYKNPYHLFSDDFNVVAPNTELVVKNMPPVRSQDAVGLCYSFATAAIIENKICRNNSTDCSKLTSDQRVSTFDLAKYTFRITKDDDTDPASYNQLPGPDTKGTNGVQTLINAVARTQEVAKESCAPFDKAVAKYGGNTLAEEAAWKDLEQKYNLAKNNPSTCLSCLADDVANNFDISKDRVDILKAFSADTYTHFLYNLFIPKDCSKKNNLISLKKIGKIGRFPLSNPSNVSYDTYINQIKSLLSRQIPVASSVCSDQVRSPESNDQCREGHEVVITGYRKICAKSGTCYDSIKIHNSYGQKWQEYNNDGWVSAKDFIDRIPRGEYDTLNWLE